MNNIEILENKIQCFKESQNTLDDDEKELFEEGIQQKEVEAIENLIRENEKLKEIIFNIRHKLKGKVITKNDNIYAPAKNLSKQEVYQSFVDISIYLKANYIFKDDETVIQELLEEGE